MKISSRPVISSSSINPMKKNGETYDVDRGAIEIDQPHAQEKRYEKT